MLAHPAALPSLPRAVALQMTEVVHDEPSLCRANQLMGNDPALTAHRLRFAAPRWTTTPTSRWREGFIWHSGAPVPARPIWTKREWPFLSLGLDIDMVLQQDPIDWTAWSEASDYVV